MQGFNGVAWGSASQAYKYVTSFFNTLLLACYLIWDDFKTQFKMTYILRGSPFYGTIGPLLYIVKA